MTNIKVTNMKKYSKVPPTKIFRDLKPSQMFRYCRA